MPVSFPSHQGLILPLWRRYPRHIDAVALSVGAITPDVVEWLSWFFRRDMSQRAGHSLVGIPLLCVPLGWALSRVAWVALGAWLFVRCLRARKGA